MSLNPKKEESHLTSLISKVRCQTFASATKSTITAALAITLIIALMTASSPYYHFITSGLATSSAPPLPTISTIPSAPSTIGQDGKEGDFTTQAVLSSLSARPTNNIVNTNSFYDVVFLTASTGAIKKIEVTVPIGTAIPNGAFFNEAEKCVSGSDCIELTGTATKSGQTIIYTVNNAVNIPVGTKIRLEFSNINNPLQVSANYKVTVTTRDAANTIIDGPSQSIAYTIKQIGANIIADSSITNSKLADNSITTNKITDNSITTTKPNEGFMKRVTLLDNTAGNALGWNPNGVTTSFTITEPAVSGVNSGYVSATVELGGAPACRVIGQFSGGFSLLCDVAPGDVAELHYVVENLPSHVPV